MTNEVDKKQFVQLISDNQNIIHKICHIYCYNTEDKRDLYQEITLQLWKSYPAWLGKAAFSTWISRVALNTAISKTRRKRDFVNIEGQQLQILSDIRRDFFYHCNLPVYWRQAF